MWIRAGLFSNDTRLSKCSGTTSLSIDNNLNSSDIVKLQIRLQTLGFLDASFSSYGYFDDDTVRAVNKYKGEYLKDGNKDDNVGVVGIDTWKHLELYEEYFDGSRFSATTTQTLSEISGRVYAIYLISNYLKEAKFAVADSGKITWYSYNDISLAAKYYDKLVCAINAKYDIKGLVFGIDWTVASFNRADDAIQASGPLPYVAATSAIAQGFVDAATTPGISTALEYYFGKDLDAIVKKSADEFDKVYQSEYRYVLINSNVRFFEISNYRKFLLKTIQDIRVMDLSKYKNINKDEFQKASIRFIERILYFNINFKEAENNAELLVK